jgi:hypothetical protein
MRETSNILQSSIDMPILAIFANLLFGILLLAYCLILTYFFLNIKMQKSIQKVDVKPIIPEHPTSISEERVVKPKLIKYPKRSYRMEEENTKKSSSEFTRRGMLWSKHASWHLPTAPRESVSKTLEAEGLETINAILKKYDVDLIKGFLPSQDPLQRLPYARYHIW